MDDRFTIRPAQIKDAARLAELSDQLGYPSQREQVRTRLKMLMADPDQVVFVADLPGMGAAGWVHVYRQALLESDLTAEIGGLVVDQACRRMGIGQKLMGAAEDWAREKGCVILHLRSNIIREGAHAFYKALGYEINKTQYSFIKEL